MKILIPSHCLEFTGEVQQVLLLAAEQGFNISNIELGVSPTQCIELVDTETSRLYSNLFELSGDGYLDRELTFLYEMKPQEVCLPNVVQIGVSYDERLVDSWIHLDETTLLIHSQSLSSNQSWRHFAWIVASLALDFPLEDALVLSRAAMNVSRETWPTQFQHFPAIEQPAVSIAQTGFTTLCKQSLGLYPVVDNVEWIERLLKLGIKTIQLRIKDPNEPSLEQQIVKAIQLGREHKAQVFINDYWQLALKHNAFGVHLGQEDVLDADLELIADSGVALGLSTHGYFELLRIHQLSPSYIALGHIFPTTTKQMPSKPQGLVRLGLYQKLLDSMPYGKSIGVPSVAIGGIDLDNIQQVLDQGVSSIAVVRAITEAKNVEANVRELQSKFSRNLNKQEVFDAI
ncbi:thiamine phosphate synthase [Vibrio diazotrophicus]|uniref:Thiamine-phosphate synthase n=1 Tax=Vibrio diazotrophicus TaxID=685 RepID=A0A329EG59_VIBDI|nr:thiamine phosphate synthase [Vibrio diazotrophicus]RAS59631.1 thiamine-phosphate diphosphorylase [Vibrio diazotrophicus]